MINEQECKSAKAWMNLPDDEPIKFEFDKVDDDSLSEDDFMTIYANLLCNIAIGQKHFRKTETDPDFMSAEKVVGEDGLMSGMTLKFETDSTDYTLPLDNEKTITFNSPKTTKRALQVLQAYGYTKDTVDLKFKKTLRDSEGSLIEEGIKVKHYFDYPKIGEVHSTEELMMKIGEMAKPKKVEVTISKEYKDFINVSNKTTGWRSCFRSFGEFHASVIILSRSKEALVVEWKDKGSEKKLGRRWFFVNENSIMCTSKAYGTDLPGLKERIAQELNSALGREHVKSSSYSKNMVRTKFNTSQREGDGIRPYFDNLGTIWGAPPSTNEYHDFELTFLNKNDIMCPYCERDEHPIKDNEGYCSECRNGRSDSTLSHRVMGDDQSDHLRDRETERKIEEARLANMPDIKCLCCDTVTKNPSIDFYRVSIGGEAASRTVCQGCFETEFAPDGSRGCHRPNSEKTYKCELNGDMLFPENLREYLIYWVTKSGKLSKKPKTFKLVGRPVSKSGLIYWQLDGYYEGTRKNVFAPQEHCKYTLSDGSYILKREYEATERVA